MWLKIWYGEEMYLKLFLTDVLKKFAHVGHHPWLGKIIQNFDKVVWHNYEYITSSKDRFLYMMGGHDAVLHGETHTMAL